MKRFFLLFTLITGSLLADCGCGIEADFLYWSPRNCRLQYAITVLATGPSVQEIEDFEALCPEFAEGFRVAASKTFCDTEAVLRYTRFDNTYHDTIRRNVIPYLTLPLLEDNASTAASAKYHVKLQVFDAELGRCWSFCHPVDFCTYAGVKVALISQSMHSQFFGSASAAQRSHFRQSVQLDAYGLYAGVNTAYNFWCECKLLGDLSFGLLPANIRWKYKAHAFQDGASPTIVDSNLRSKCNRMVGNLNWSLALSGTIHPCFDLTFNVGYEMHLWLNTQAGASTLFGADGIGDASSYLFFNSHDILGFDGLFIRLSTNY